MPENSKNEVEKYILLRFIWRAKRATKNYTMSQRQIKHTDSLSMPVHALYGATAPRPLLRQPRPITTRLAIWRGRDPGTSGPA